MTQYQRYELARRNIADGNNTFMEMLNSGNRITKRELRVLIAKRPALWSRFAGYLETNVLPD